MAASLDGADLSAPCDLVTLTDDIPDIWIESLFDLKGTINPVHRAGFRSCGFPEDNQNPEKPED